MSIIFERMPPTPSGVRYIQTAHHDERNENKKSTSHTPLPFREGLGDRLIIEHKSNNASQLHVTLFRACNITTRSM